jgi:uncharacterized membrane protein
MQLDRVKALTDGVLAIVMTILVLGFEVPDHQFSEEGLLSFLAKMREPLAAYVVSFGIAAAYWVQHAVIFHYVTRGNRTFIWLNILFLLPLTLLPFLTDLRATYHDVPHVTMLYASANVICGMLVYVIWRYAIRAGLTTAIPAAVDRSMSHRILMGVGLNVLGAALAPIDTYLSSAAFLLLPALYLSHAVVDRHWVSGRAPVEGG